MLSSNIAIGVTAAAFYIRAIRRRMSTNHTREFITNCLYYEPLALDTLSDGLKRLADDNESGIKVKELSVKNAISLKENSTTFNTVLFKSLLRTKALGRLLLYSPTIPSSQTMLKTYFDGVQSGLICIVDRQSQGKGRGGNTWESPHGCSMFSFKSKEVDGSRLPFIQYMISLAIVRAVKKLSGEVDVDIGIKWPNDIYVNKTLKIGGVLCQSSFYKDVFDVTIGCGINTTNDKPTVSLNSLLQPGSKPILREQVIAEILNQYEGMMDKFRSEGFTPFEKEYCSVWLHTNQRVKVVERSGTNPIDVTIKGIASVSGGLFATDDNGCNYELYPDGNRFDFFNGLIRRKL